jgi:glycosyltransferase involved in cell wall biosynthesis
MGAAQVQLQRDAALSPAFRSSTMPSHPIRKTTRVLWLGRLLPIKAVGLAVLAMERIPADTGIELEIVGDGPDGAWLKARLAASPAGARIVWRGRIPWNEVAARMAAADVFLHTSIRDSCAAQAFEAMCHGLPIVALALHGVADHVPAEGAILVPPQDPMASAQGLAQALLDLHRDPERRRRMGEINYRASEQCLWPAFAAEMERRLISIVQGVGISDGTGHDSEK